jgi:SecD/SecF fusion protein
MRALVSIFAVLLILISLYQLSFTWFVNKHEASMEDQARNWVSRNYTPAERKYPGNKELQALYQDTLNDYYNERLRRLLDSTRDKKITWWGHSYQKSKESELLLGLDLQGGINVTLDIALDGLIKGLANNPKDPQLLKAIAEAQRRKVNSDADFITLFSQSFNDVNQGTRLAPLFANSTKNKLKMDASDNAVTTWLREQARAAMQQTYQVLTKRIDKFGVAQPNVNLDENKGIINVELAGAKDPERVRRYLQSTANLQFWELYDVNELAQSIQAADKALENYQASLRGVDTTKPAQAPGINIQSVGGDTNTVAAAGPDTTRKPDTAANTATANANSNPLFRVIQFAQPQQDDQGKQTFSPYIGAAAIKDTGLINNYLSLPVVRNNFPSNVKFLWGKQERDADGKALDFLYLYAIKTVPGTDKAKLEGEVITDARQDFEQISNRVIVNMSMNKQGERIWEKMTTDAFNAGRKPIAIVLDDIVYSAPYVNQPISGGSSTITMGSGAGADGKAAIQDGADLANILKSGKLEAPAKIVQEQVVGPTLGQKAITGGTWAFVISFAVIFILMLIYFNTAGWVANITLILNLLFTVGILSMAGSTLTAAGIAGLVLTIGMAVDTNVIIFERIKEELTKGKTYNLAFREGYRRSLAPVLDGHITTLLTACILFYFGLGPVLGFATTQIIGILMSLFCGIVVAWLITDWWNKRDRHFKYFTNLSRTIYRKAHFNFVGYRKYAYIISVVVLALGIGAFFNGFNEGVEFSGGRSYVVKFNRQVDPETVKNDLEKVFEKHPVVKTYGGNDQLDITTDYLIKEETLVADSMVVERLYAGLQPYMAGVSKQDFVNNRIMQTKKVVPTISDDLKTGAKWATFWSLLAISLYILIRFRDWRYSVGTIVALLHDVLVMLIVFSFFKNIVPFPLEIDQHFIAAILTVIGFSMNDTVVVFDRVREYSREMKGADKATILNRAINDTLTRTIMTSLTVFLTLLVLFLVGGEVTRGFAFAMLIGVVTGIYSSIFVAAPILVDFARNKPLGSADAATSAASEPKGKPVMAKLK